MSKTTTEKKADASEKLMSVYTFLRRYPQDEVVTIVLKTAYKMQAKTLQGWYETVDKIKHERVY